MNRPLHPEAQQYLDSFQTKPRPGWETLEPVVAREMFNTMMPWFGQGPQLERVETLELDGIRTRLYQPDSHEAKGAIVYFHGGGWVLGNLNSHDALCRSLALASDVPVIAVDYRLSPEHRFPAALDDATAIVQHLQRPSVTTTDACGFRDSNKLVVAGDSAGGNLAAAVCQRLRDNGDELPDLQVLLYPVVTSDLNSTSYRDFAEGFGLTRAAMRWFWQLYPSDQSPPSPLYADLFVAEDYSSLPPALVVTAGYDVLRDEGDRYAQNLQAAGVSTTAKAYPDMIHGFMHLSSVFSTGRAAIADVGQWIRAQLDL